MIKTKMIENDQSYEAQITGRFMGQIEGWAIRLDQPDLAVSVDVYRDAVKIDTVVANIFDPVLVTKGLGNANHVFVYEFRDEDYDGKIHTFSFQISQISNEIKGSPLTVQLNEKDRQRSFYEGRLRPIEDNNIVKGWAFKKEGKNGTSAIEVDFYIDEVFHATVKGNEYFNRIITYRQLNERCHFEYILPESFRDDKPHILRAYIGGTSIELPGSKITFNKNHSKIYASGFIDRSSLCSDYAEFETPHYIASGCVIQKFSTLGAFSYLQRNVFIWPYVKIGRYCSIASNVIIGPSEHDYHRLSTHPFLFDFEVFKKNKSYVFGKKSTGKAQSNVEIGNDVWIGANAVILRGIQIGDGAVIAAGAVVTKDIEAYSIVGGVPAKVIKMRFDNSTLERLVKIKWWELPIERLAAIDMHDLESALDALEAVRFEITPEL